MPRKSAILAEAAALAVAASAARLSAVAVAYINRPRADFGGDARVSRDERAQGGGNSNLPVEPVTSVIST